MYSSENIPDRQTRGNGKEGNRTPILEIVLSVNSLDYVLVSYVRRNARIRSLIAIAGVARRGLIQSIISDWEKI